MGPVPGLRGISRMACMKTIRRIFRLFFHTPVFLICCKNTPQNGVQQTSNILKIDKRLLIKSSLEIMPAKRASKVWKSYSLQRFKPISKVPRYPKKAPKLDPIWILKLKNVRKWRTQKNNKKQTTTKSAKGSKWGPNGGAPFTPVTSQKSQKF